MRRQPRLTRRFALSRGGDMNLNLPERGRPRGVRYRKCDLGVDLPSDFVHELKSLDSNLYPVFHPYRMLWDSIVNDYSGPLDDPRYQIEYKYGELNFGFVLTNGQGRPSPDGSWHIWRWCEPHGWAHVINIDSKDRQYLDLLVKRLWLQDRYHSRYGHRGYQKLLEEADIEQREKQQLDKQDLMNEIGKTNSAMLGRCAENMARGLTKPTNPTKDIIFSAAGVNNKSKIVRSLSDREGGLVLPEGLGEEW